MPRQDVRPAYVRCGKQRMEFLGDLPARSRQRSRITERVAGAIITANTCHPRNRRLHRPPRVGTHTQGAVQHDGGAPLTHAVEEQLPPADIDQAASRRIESRLTPLRHPLVNEAEADSGNCHSAEDCRAHLQYSSDLHRRVSYSRSDKSKRPFVPNRRCTVERSVLTSADSCVANIDNRIVM